MQKLLLRSSVIQPQKERKKEKKMSVIRMPQKILIVYKHSHINVTERVMRHFKPSVSSDTPLTLAKRYDS